MSLEKPVPCGVCGAPTRMTGTRRCGRCWELEQRIAGDFDLAIKIIRKEAAERLSVGIATKLPMREKYVDEAVGPWMIFGRHSDGAVDVGDGNRDVFHGIPKEKAEQVVAAHDLLMSRLYALLSRKEDDGKLGPQRMTVESVAKALYYSETNMGVDKDLTHYQCETAAGYILKRLIGLNAMTGGEVEVQLDSGLGKLFVHYQEPPK